MTATLSQETAEATSDHTPSMDEELEALGIHPAGVVFSTRAVPWAKQGTVINKPVTAEEAINMAGLNFEVHKEEVASRSSADAPWRVIPNRVAVTRSDTGVRLVVASTDYELVQYGEVFAFMDKVAPNIVAAGPLYDGRQAFIVAQRPDLTYVDPDLGEADPHQPYVVLRTSHDLSRAVEAGILLLRGRCMNQLTLRGFLNGAQQRWSIRHTRKAKEHLAQAADVYARLGTYTDEFTRIARRLAAVEVDLKDAQEVLEGVLPDRPRRQQAIDTILGIWQTADTVGFRDNGWGLTNAVGDYLEHGRTSANTTPQSRFLGALQGTQHRTVNRVAALLLTR
jgi:phage/plasmid-like protein (TIGR03299 family)